MRYAIIILWGWLCLVAPPAWAEDGRTDFLAGLAQQYHPEKPDYGEAARLYLRAAQAGSREALLGLARLTAPQGPLWTDGRAWLQNLSAAAQAGWPEAAFELAQALERGDVSAPGLSPARYYLQAAAAGHGPAALRLGEMYLSGTDELGADRDQAALWFSVAAQNHEDRAALALGKLYEDRPALAARWLEKSRQPEAHRRLADIYFKERRFLEAVNGYTYAADHGDAQAHLALGLINLDNEFGRRPNPREALRHLKIAAQNDLPEGSYHLAHMYLKGEGTPKDPITAAFWLHRAAAKGHPQAGTEFEKLTYNFTTGHKKRLERMIEEGVAPTMQTPVQ